MNPFAWDIHQGFIFFSEFKKTALKINHLNALVQDCRNSFANALEFP